MAYSRGIKISSIKQAILFRNYPKRTDWAFAREKSNHGTIYGWFSTRRRSQVFNELANHLRLRFKDTAPGHITDFEVITSLHAFSNINDICLKSILIATGLWDRRPVEKQAEISKIQSVEELINYLGLA